MDQDGTAAEAAWLAQLTGAFETAGDPWTAVAGDFDGQGVSGGVLQWNLGQGTLQPILLAVPAAERARLAPLLAPALARLLALPAKQGARATARWTVTGALLPKYKAELRALLGAPAARAAQAARIATLAEEARRQAERFCAGAPVSRRMLAFFFDLVVQNGGLRGVGPAEVEGFRRLYGANARGQALAWLAAAPADWWGVRDCRRNAALWAEHRLDAEGETLLLLAHLRARIAGQPRARGVVMNRKGAIAVGQGWVNGAKADLRPVLGLT